MRTRKQIETLILTSLLQNKQRLQEQFESSKDEIGYFVLDDLLPEDFVTEVYEAFPKSEELVGEPTAPNHCDLCINPKLILSLSAVAYPGFTILILYIY